MARFEESVVVERPIEEVFAFLHNPVNDPRWKRGVVEAWQTSTGPMGVGTTMVEVARFLGQTREATIEVTEYEPPRRSSVRLSWGPIQATGSYVLEASGVGTRFTMAGVADARGFMGLIEPLWLPLMRSRLRGSARDLKGVLERAG